MKPVHRQLHWLRVEWKHFQDSIQDMAPHEWTNGEELF